MRHTLLTLCALAFVATLALAALWRFDARRALSVDLPLRDREAHWLSRIDAVGGEAAYKEFARYAVAYSPGIQHQEVHIFGDALYDSEGLPGLAVCDSRFSFGCYHAFLGRAIATRGLGIVRALDEDCFRELGPGLGISCQHGIGHGILTNIGYDEDSLQRALTICSELPYNDPVGGCYGGVFMEYNMHTVLGDAARAATADLQAPCDHIGSAFRSTCYFYQAQWWLNLQHVEHGKDFLDVVALGAQCAGAGTPALVRACYEGLGTVLPPESDFEAAPTARYCEQSSPDPVLQLYCRSFAANAIHEGGDRAEGVSVCSGLTGRSLSYCTAYATNKANLAAQLPSLTLEDL